MAAFSYQATDRDGTMRRGVVEAGSAREARARLRRASLSPQTLVRAGAAAKEHRAGLQASERLAMTRQLAMMVSAGIPVHDALRVVEQGVGAGSRMCIASVRNAVLEGWPLSDALARQPGQTGRAGAFPVFYIAIVRAGEQAGALGPALARLATHLERDQSIGRRLVTALAYPLILALVAIAVVAALMVVVVPQLAAHLTDLGQSLPLLTRGVIAVSDGLARYGTGILIGLGLGALIAARLVHSDAAQLAGARLVRSLPVAGALARDNAAARFCRTFATLAGSGVPVTEALNACAATHDLLLQAAVRDMQKEVIAGGKLSAAMAHVNLFPPLVVQMAAGGEESGRLGPLFEKSADYLEERIATGTETALRVLEPAITIVMGAIVLVIVLAIMLPILRLNGAMLI